MELRDPYNDPKLDRFVNILILFVTVIIFSLILVITIGRQYNRLFHMNRQNELLLAELNHRVKNNLAIITSLIRLKREENNSEASDSLLDLETRVKAMALMHDNAYSKSDKQRVFLVDFTDELLDSICKPYPHNGEIECTKNIPHVDLDFTQALPFSMILNELIVNSLKHAFKNVGKPEISISCTISDDQLELI